VYGDFYDGVNLQYYDGYYTDIIDLYYFDIINTYYLDFYDGTNGYYYDGLFDCYSGSECCYSYYTWEVDCPEIYNDQDIYDYYYGDYYSSYYGYYYDGYSFCYTGWECCYIEFYDVYSCQSDSTYYTVLITLDYYSDPSSSDSNDSDVARGNIENNPDYVAPAANDTATDDTLEVSTEDAKSGAIVILLIIVCCLCSSVGCGMVGR